MPVIQTLCPLVCNADHLSQLILTQETERSQQSLKTRQLSNTQSDRPLCVKLLFANLHISTQCITDKDFSNGNLCAKLWHIYLPDALCGYVKN